MSDGDVNKLLIFTQTTVPITTTRIPKHEGHDRTGDWTTRVKMTQVLEQAINDGLYYYEEDLRVKDVDKRVSLQFTNFSNNIVYIFMLSNIFYSIHLLHRLEVTKL